MRSDGLTIDIAGLFARHAHMRREASRGLARRDTRRAARGRSPASSKAALAAGWLCIAPLFGAVDCGNDCGRKAPPIPEARPEPSRQPGPRTIVVTAEGQPRLQIELAKLESAGPAVALGIAYAPGLAPAWADNEGVPLVGHGWTLTLPCLAGAAGGAEAPAAVTFVPDGIERIEFTRGADGVSYASARVPSLRMRRDAADRFEIRDRWGNAVACAGFTARWPAAQRGKTLAYTTPYFGADRGVTFRWSAAGTLDEIIDAAGRAWCFAYAGGMLREVVVARRDGFPLARIELRYGRRTDDGAAVADGLLAVTRTLPGDLSRTASHVFRYHGEGGQAGLLASVLAPDAVASLGGVEASLAADDAEADRRASCALMYARSETEPHVVVSAFRGPRCGTCPESGWYFLDYERNREAPDAAAWAVHVTQRNPEGSTTMADFNRHGQLLNWVRAGGGADGVAQEFEAYRYDAGGRLSHIVYSSPSFVYDSHRREGVYQAGGGEGVIHGFQYDAQGRLTAEILGTTSMLFAGVKDEWTTLRTYRYEGDLPWPAAMCEHPGEGQAPVVTAVRYELKGEAAELRLVRRVEELPAVPASQNGSGTSAVREQCYDADTGALIREVDANGGVAEYAYDDETGALVRATTAAGTTRWYVDPWGRVEMTELPDGAREVLLRVPLDAGRIASVAYRTAGTGAVGPVAIVVRDLAGRVVTSAKAAPAPGLRPDEAIIAGGGDLADAWRGELAELEERVYSAGRLAAVVDWCGGTAAVTRYFYDDAGRTAAVVGADGTMVAYGYDGMSRLVRVYEGLEGSAAPLTLREKRYYDAAGRVRAVRVYRESPGNDEDRAGAVTERTYDWRNRLVEERHPDGEGDGRRTLRRVYDNLDRVIELQVKPRGGTRFSTAHVWDYDARGRLWREATVSLLDPGRRMTTRYWYDAERTRRKTLLPGGGFKKELHDAAGRVVAVCVGVDPRDGGAGEPYDDAVSAEGLADDTILEEERCAYDAGGREVLLTHRMRPAEGGVQAGPTSRQAAVWYDPLGHPVHTVVRAGEEWRARPDEVPAGTAASLRTDTAYDAFGRVREITYADGRGLRYDYDARGRVEAKTELSARDDEERIRTEYAYDGGGRVVRERVVFAGAEDAPSRETAYVYGVDQGREVPSSIASGRLLAEIRHPDPLTGAAGTRPQDRESFGYDAQGRMVRRRGPADADGSAVVRELAYDDMGRMVLDSVAAAASSTDTGVLSVARAYDAWGRLARVTAHGAARAEGDVRNEIAWEYNGFGQILSVRQSHDGACGAATPEVRCVWSEAAAGDGPSRLARLIHPAAEDGPIALDFRYTGDDARPEDLAFGRPRGIAAAFLDGRQVASYAYQGIATAVARASATAWPGFALRRSYVFDDFGRIGAAATALAWQSAPLLAIDDTRYAYDEGGRLIEESDRAPAGRGGADRVRRYDGLGRLAWWAEGDRAGDVLGNARAVERWRLSGSGNWDEHAQNGVAEQRAHDLRDALVAMDGVPCARDGEGNVTSAAGLECRYDAWNRLASFAAGSVRCRIARDGLGRPVRETVSGAEAAETTRDLYYRHPWQLVTMIERAGTRETREDYVWGLTHEDELILSHRRSGARRESFYYVQDALWNVTAVLNEIGLPIERYRYSPYGEARIGDGMFRHERDESAIGAAVRFQGRRLHGPPALGVYDFRYRAYRPRLGRFLQRDPAGIPYAHNLYAAPFGAALLDPYGLRPQLRNCWTAEVPLLGMSGGVGLVLSGDLQVRSTVCDCCGAQNAWVQGGWVENGISGGLAVGFGAAMQIEAAGVSIGFRFELASVRLLECSGTVISDRCSNETYPCVSCSRSVAFGVPILELDLGIAGIQGTAQIVVEASFTYCLVNGKSDATFSLCYGWEAWVEVRIFWIRRVLTYAGKTACLERKL